MVKVDLCTMVRDVPDQDVISRDNVSVKVNAVIYYRVVDAEKAVIQVENHHMATSQLVQATLRSVLGKHDLDEMLSERDKMNDDIQEILDTQSDTWGIKVRNVEIKHVDIDESLIRAIARQAETERSRWARSFLEHFVDGLDPTGRDGHERATKHDNLQSFPAPCRTSPKVEGAFHKSAGHGLQLGLCESHSRTGNVGKHLCNKKLLSAQSCALGAECR